MGSAAQDLRSFPEDARQRAGYQLYLTQQGLEPSALETDNNGRPQLPGDPSQCSRRGVPRYLPRHDRRLRLRAALLPQEVSSNVEGRR